MILSTLLFSLMHVLIRMISRDLHAFEIALFRNLFGLVVLAPWILRYGWAPLRTRRFPLHGLRAVLNVAAMFAFYTALGLAPIAQVTALAFSAPIFATLLAMLVLRETVRLRRWTAIAVGFLGALIILRPGVAEVDLGSLLVMASALLWGAALVVITVLARSESSMTITCYMNLLLTLLSLPAALYVWRTPDAELLGWLLAIGVFGTLGQLALAQSLKEAETGIVMPFDFLKLVWTAALGFLLFSEVPGPFVWLGGLLIFTATCYLAIRERQLARRVAAATVEAPPEPRAPA
jgi:drug/metabolite transporter (DMT)-like permease